jgi:hypothetical protein
LVVRASRQRGVQEGFGFEGVLAGGSPPGFSRARRIGVPVRCCLTIASEGRETWAAWSLRPRIFFWFGSAERPGGAGWEDSEK